MKLEDVFASCSIDELIMCLKSRREHIKEINRFLKDDIRVQYKKIKWDCLFKKAKLKREMKYIIKRVREKRGIYGN